MEVKEYYYYIIIVEEGSITKAAKRIGVSQPYLSEFVSSLEAKYKTKLIERNCKPIKLTSDGLFFLKIANNILNEERRFQNFLLSKKEKQKIRIGIGTSRTKYLVGDSIINYIKNNNCAFEIKEIINEEAQKTLEENKVDVIIHYGCIDVFNSIFLFSETLQFVCLKSLFDSYDSMDDIPFIALQKTQEIRNQYNNYINKNSIVLECNNLDTALYFVEKGLGSTIVPSYISMRLDRKQFAVVDISNCQKRDVFISFRDDEFVPNYVKEFIDTFSLELRGSKDV